MSLINEALKRTRANLKNPRGPGSDAGMHPVEGAPASRRRWGLAALAVCLLGLAGLFLAKPWHKKPGPAAEHRALPAVGKNTVRQADSSPGGGRLAAGVATLASAQALATSRTQAFSNLSAVVEAPAPGARASQSAPAAVQTATQAVASARPAVPPASSAPAATASSKLPFPALKLQGIFFRSSNPSALINSQTVFQGEKVQDVKVVNIEPERVTVEWNGQTRVLTFR